MERILACLSPSPSNPKILRAAADMAGDRAELIALFGYPRNRKPDRKIDVTHVDVIRLTFLCNRCKGENVIIVIERFISDEKLVTLADLVVLSLKFKVISREIRLALVNLKSRREMAACRFHVSVAHVYADDPELVIVLNHTDTSLMLRILDKSISIMRSCAVFFDELSVYELTMNVVFPILCSHAEMRTLLLFSVIENPSFSNF